MRCWGRYPTPSTKLTSTPPEPTPRALTNMHRHTLPNRADAVRRPTKRMLRNRPEALPPPPHTHTHTGTRAMLHPPIAQRAAPRFSRPVSARGHLRTGASQRLQALETSHGRSATNAASSTACLEEHGCRPNAALTASTRCGSCQTNDFHTLACGERGETPQAMDGDRCGWRPARPAQEAQSPRRSLHSPATSPTASQAMAYSQDRARPIAIDAHQRRRNAGQQQVARQHTALPPALGRQSLDVSGGGRHLG